MILNGMLAKTEYYKTLSNLNFIQSKTLNKRIGIDEFIPFLVAAGKQKADWSAAQAARENRR